jgi:AraC-like DNA-binding protein
MRKIVDSVAEFPGTTIIHQKIPSHEVGRHVHAEHEFFLPLQGEITIQSDTGIVKAGPGRMLYVPPDIDHSFSSTAQGSGERIIWLIDKKLWQKHTDRPFEPTSLPSNSLVKELLFFLLIHQNVEGAKYFVSALVASLVESLNGATLQRQRIFSEHIDGKVQDARIKRALQMMDESEMALTEIAEKSGLSGRNFTRLFLQEVGVSPKDYLILKRIEKAKHLLKETRMTVTDISFEVGYNSLSKFIAMFKKIEGILPSDYRASFVANRGQD